MIRYMWESDRDHRLAKLFRERHALSATILILQLEPDWGPKEEQQHANLARQIEECDVEIEKISAETYEEALANYRSSQFDQLRKE